MSKTSHSDSSSKNLQRSVDLLIVTALDVERDALLRHFHECEKIQPDDIPATYYVSSFSVNTKNISYDVAITMLNQIGNISSTFHTMQAINELNPKYVLMVGIAGGIQGKVNLGDVVVSEQIFYYEPAKETISGLELRPQVYPADPVLLNRAKNYENDNWHNLIDAQRPDGSSGHDFPTVYFCPFAVGEKVVADKNRAIALRNSLHAKLLAIEMESFGVALAAAHAAHRPRFLAIRGISDHANRRKNNKWHKYAAASAAAFTIGFLRSGPVPPHNVIDEGVPTHRTLIAMHHQSMEPFPPRAIWSSLPPDLANSDFKELVLNQADLYVNSRLTDPLEAARRQIALTQEFSHLLALYPDADIAYYGIAHIPLLFLMGGQLLHRRPLHLFEHNRQTQKWDVLQIGGRYPKLKLHGLPINIDQKEGDVVVRISISYLVRMEEIAGIVPDPLASLHLAISRPKIDAVTSPEQIREYSNVFRQMLDEIHNRLPNTGCLHVFYSGPVTLAVSFGQNISRTIHPKIVVYNYVFKDKGYDWGLDVTSDINSPNFVVRVDNRGE